MMDLSDLTLDEPTKVAIEGARSELAGYVMSRVKRWRETRDSNYKEQWNKYYAIFRGTWTQDLKVKQAERSKIITPATQQAIDQTVSEMVEATFGRGDWLDIADKEPAEVAKVQQVHDNLLQDLEMYGTQSAIVDTYYNGAIYGTGIAKRIVDKTITYDYQTGQQGPIAVEKSKYCVKWEAVPPYNFVIDTAATKIEDAHGVAHETVRPLHEVRSKQASKEYLPGEVGIASSYTQSGSMQLGPGMASYETDPVDGVYITEYHGLVPKRLVTAIRAVPKPDNSDVAVDEPTTDGTDVLVEAIVTIANNGTTLKAVENPILGKSRGFVAYQHHKAPNRFWGIGQAEKAFNSQSALDGEVRARMDTLALTTYPSVTADATRLPRNLNLSVVPGKVFLTNGRGSEIIEPIKFGDASQSNFQNAADLERMVQMATGAEDPTKSVNNNPRMEAASGASMAQAPYIKRAKLTMQNVDTDFLAPLAKKTMEAYMTFDGERYPLMYKYVVKSSMSIMAREFEQSQMTNLLAVMDKDSPVYNIVVRGIVENYSGPSKDAMLAALDQMMQPDPQQKAMQQQQQMLTMAQAEATVQKLQAEVKAAESQVLVNQSMASLNQTKSQQMHAQVAIQAAQTQIESRKTAVQEQQVEISREHNHMQVAAHVHATNKAHEAAMRKSNATDA